MTALRPVLAILAALALWSPATAHAGFVTRSGTELRLDGQPYRFAGINVYNANNRLGCWYALGSGPDLGTALDQMGGAAKVVRAWFFQDMATTGGVRDWSAFDHTLSVAAAHGARVIATLTNQWPDCDGLDAGPGAYKTTDWYTTGYRQPDPGGTASYRDYAAEIAARYRDNPTILAWQLINEAEVNPYYGGPCEAGAAATLKAWAADVSGAIKAADPNHLVSLGTIGNGPCGTSFNEYQDVHDVPGIDVCEYHDYGAPQTAFPGDVYNGLQKRIDQCNALGKPLIVGETGIEPSHLSTPTLQGRADAFASKFRAQFGAGIDGELVWAWNRDGSSLTGFDVGPGDPALATLASFNWDFAGFSQPVDNGAVLNVVKAGQAVPLKWRLTTFTGQPVTTLASATPRVAALDCASGTSADDIEEVATTGSGLQNLGNGYYQLNWKTDKAFAGSCRKLLLDLGEGITHPALFRFTR